PVTTARLLLAEDDLPLAGFVSRTLETCGYAVDSVQTGIDALKHLQRAAQPYDLVLLDLVLPWLNGLELFATMRADPRWKEVTVLVTTGTFVPPRQFEGDPRVSVLHKPFDETQLVVAVETLLYGSPLNPH